MQAQEQSQPQQPNNNDPPSEQAQRPKKEKPKKESWALKPEHLETKKGLRALYEKSLTLNLDESATVNVEATMKKIIVVLKTWHFEMAPKYSFEYFIQRLQALGTHQRVTAYMSKVRKIHKGMDVWEEEPGPNQPKREQEAEAVNQPPKSEREGGRSLEQEMREQLNLLDERKPVQEYSQEEGDEQLFDMMKKLENSVAAKKEANATSKPQADKQYEDYLPDGHYDFEFSEENM